MYPGRVFKKKPDPATEALSDALEYDDLARVVAALEAGADPDPTREPCGDTPMRLVLQSDHPDSLEMLRALLRHGGRPDGRPEGLLYTVPVFEAAKHGQLEKLKVLLDAGADVNGRDPEDDETALMAAARFGYLEIAKLLVARGADVTLSDSVLSETALETALQGTAPGCREVVEFLRRMPGASPALNSAGGNVEVAAVLVEECLDGDDRRFPLHALWSDSDVGAVKRLLLAGYDVNQLDEESGETPLSCAARLGQPKMVEFLLAQGGDPTVKDADGDTPRKSVESYVEHEPRRRRGPYLAILKLLDAHGACSSRGPNVQGP